MQPRDNRMRELASEILVPVPVGRSVAADADISSLRQHSDSLESVVARPGRRRPWNHGPYACRA